MSQANYGSRPAEDHSQLIADLGGATAVAGAIKSRLGIRLTSQAVSNWKRRGIPFRYRGALVVLAQEKGAKTPADFFGVTGGST